MMSISIGEFQKNTSILTKITEALEIVDMRKKQTVAVVYPVHKVSMIDAMAGKYAHRVEKVDDLSRAKNDAMMMAFGEKYDLSS